MFLILIIFVHDPEMFCSPPFQEKQSNHGSAKWSREFHARPKRKMILSPFCTLLPNPLSSATTGCGVWFEPGGMRKTLHDQLFLVSLTTLFSPVNCVPLFTTPVVNLFRNWNQITNCLPRLSTFLLLESARVLGRLLVHNLQQILPGFRVDFRLDDRLRVDCVFDW